jgi:hypothetical protein
MLLLYNHERIEKENLPQEKKGFSAAGIAALARFDASQNDGRSHAKPSPNGCFSD